VLASTGATRGLARARGGFPDWPLMLAAARPELALLGYRYPRAFRHLVVPGEDAEPIAALVARQPASAAPAVIVVHGAMTSKHFDYVRRAAVRAYGLGFHVLALDLRGFGVTALTSEAPTSLGWAEGGDVLAAGRWLRQRGATSVAAIGFSLGAAAVLCAARRAGPGELDGGVLSFSAPADLGEALETLSMRPSWRDPLFGTWLTLHAAATTRLRAGGYGHEAHTLREAVELVSAPWYGLDVDALARRASPAGWIGEVRVPVLAVHAVDDVVIPVAHARRLTERAAGNDDVHVLVRPSGGHAAFDLVDPVWTAGVERAWLGALARWPEA
jgi:predicted alpha/beta-fold hydrolase